MKTYISICSPHVGIVSGPLAISFSTPTESMKQLKLHDHTNFNFAYLYELSRENQLKWFKRVIVIASSDEPSSIYDSSKIQCVKGKTPK